MVIVDVRAADQRLSFMLLIGVLEFDPLEFVRHAFPEIRF